MEIKNVSFQYGKNKILKNIYADIEKGKITSVIGPNGSGKSTLFNIISKNLKPYEGEVLLDGVNINKIRIKNFARKVAAVHQQNTCPGDVNVRELVSWGRIPHKKMNSSMSDKDEEIIDWAMKAAYVKKYEDKSISSLSGGEKQRVWIAMALAQKTEMLLLDEPTSYLDMSHQTELLKLIHKLNSEYGMTVCMVLHDLNQAVSYSHNIIGLKNGKVVAQCPAEEMMNEKNISMIFDMSPEIISYNNKKYVLNV